MAICSKCGSELGDGVKFCGVCGAPVMAESAAGAAAIKAETENAAKETTVEAAAGIAAAETAAESAATDAAAGITDTQAAAADADTMNAALGKTPSQTASPYNYRNNYEEPAAGIKQSIREFAGSGLFLFYILLTLASLVLSFIGGGAPGIIGTAVFYIPTILCLLGMIIGFADARSESGPVGKGIGLYRLGKGIGIFYVVLISAFIILAVLFSTYLVTSRPDFFEALGEYLPSEINLAISSFLSAISEVKEAVLVLVVIVIVLVAIFLVLAILYFKSLMDAAASIRKSLAQGKRSGHVSLFPAVIRIILAVFAIPGCISTFANMSQTQTQISQILNSMDLGIDLENTVIRNSFSLLPSINMALGTLSLIIGIILIFKLRRRINEI